MEQDMIVARRKHCDGLRVFLVTAALGFPGLVQPASADVITSISVGSDQALIYPTDLPTLPDQHLTFFPPPRGSTSYIVFASSNILGGPEPPYAGTVVLEMSDLVNFSYATGYTNPVMVPPVTFGMCDGIHDTEFDENYAAPGSVLQDPTQPAGHFMMIYEAENHCPGGTHESEFYNTTGYALSTDYGQTWPATAPSEFGARHRRPVIKLSVPEPTTTPTSPMSMGNGIPAAFIDKTASGEHYIYVTYLFVGTDADGNRAEGYIRMARAKLGDGKLEFKKWYIGSSGTGSFSQHGLGGFDSAVTPSHGCSGSAGRDQLQGSISYVAATKQYLLTFVCVQFQGSPGQPYQAGWYYSTATSLELQDWSDPQAITGSVLPVMPGCPNGSFDGWYPSFMSPHHQPGHLGKTGQVFFLNGCDSTGSGRFFVSRTFTITIGP